MYEIVRSPLTKHDVKAIWRYGVEKWGEDRANAYVWQLDAAIQMLTENPKIGKPQEHIRAGYRCIRVNRHMLYYRLKGKTITITRVLHERMEVGPDLLA